MGAHNLSEYGNDIRTELYCDDTVHVPTVINRAVAKTEALLGRLIPKKNVAEATITIDRTSQALVINSETGTTDYKPIKYDSESISTTEAAGGTIMVRGTDYTINYMTGVVTKLDTGSALSDGTYFITYKQDPMRLDIGSLVTNPIKITRIEYPVGDQPPTYLGSFDLIEDYIIFHKDTVLTEGKHIRIYYDSLWTGATASTDGEYPSHLDDVIIIGAAGQCLIFKAEEYVQSAVTELLLVNVAADSMATPLADINAALDKIATYLETYNDNDNARTLLARIADETASLRTAIETALDESLTFLTHSSSPAAPSAEYYLTTGDDKIVTLNVSDRVAEKYADYARAAIQIYQGLTTEAALRLDNLRSMLEESAAWVAIAAGFRDEAVQRINEVGAWAAQADRYTTTSRQYLDIAGRYLASGQAKIMEFYTMLGFKPEIQHTRAASSQPSAY